MLPQNLEQYRETVKLLIVVMENQNYLVDINGNGPNLYFVKYIVQKNISYLTL